MVVEGSLAAPVRSTGPDGFDLAEAMDRIALAALQLPGRQPGDNLFRPYPELYQ